VAGDLAAQIEESLRVAVAVVARITHGGAELFDDGRGRGVVGIAHAQVNDILAGAAQAVLERVELAEDVGRQRLDAG